MTTFAWFSPATLSVLLAAAVCAYLMLKIKRWLHKPLLDLCDPPLELYEGRKLDATGQRPRFWIGLRPCRGDLPTKAQIDAAVQQMLRDHAGIASVDRPDDGKKHPHEIEDHHVTFVAMITDRKDGFDAVKRIVEESQFRASDLRPKRDFVGPVLRSLRKGNTVFLIQEYEESDRLKRARIRTAKDYCQPYDETTQKGYIVHDAHVTLAYGNLPKPAPAAAPAAAAPAAAPAATSS